MNDKAKKINDKLGVKIFNENSLGVLKLVEYSKEEIKELQIDDLIVDGYWTKRLASLVNSIEMGEHNDETL